jgi:predicted DNA-binding transcriptional regulator YafY
MPPFKFPRQRYDVINSLMRRNGKFYTAEEILDVIYERTGQDISRDMLNKDFKAMRDEYQAPIVYNSTYKGYTYRDHQFTIDDIPVTADDRDMLNFALDALKVFRGTELLNRLQSTVDKILVTADTPRRSNHSKEEILLSEEPLTNIGTKWLEKLYTAILEKSTLEIQYHKFGEKLPEQKIVSPYLLKEFRNRWYLLAYDHRNKRSSKIVVLGLDRITSIDYSNQPFTKDPDFNPADFFRYSFGVYHRHDQQPESVKLEFYPPQLDYIRTQPLHPNQRVTEYPDSSKMVVELDVYIGPELIFTILGYGSGVKVLAPQSLIDEIREEARRILDSYG